jgi:hypothetical protein
MDSHPLVIEEELHQKSFHPDFLEDYDGAKEETSDGLPDDAFSRELETSVFLMPIMHMTTRLIAP